ncbi:MAG: zinc ribbon domain-containing protein, partial [Acidobacteriia bacterium]|nr:zinc ribbon domain-containing protein [Terriglobia bacterium]
FLRPSSTAPLPPHLPTPRLSRPLSRPLSASWNCIANSCPRPAQINNTFCCPDDSLASDISLKSSAKGLLEKISTDWPVNERCGYGLYRTSTPTSARRLCYYRCLGCDAYRHLKGAVCDNPPVRQDQLDAVVWKELTRKVW